MKQWYVTFVIIAEISRNVQGLYFSLDEHGIKKHDEHMIYLMTRLYHSEYFFV